jgi:predicted helicase
MKGLYLLTTKQLIKDKTIKFGMSMRIQYRWIDYLAIFSDSEYIYYYEFLDDLTREDILDIEYEILQLHENERNEFYQTEYFYCKDYDKFHQSIVNVLDRRKINYKIHNIHNFERKYYDNKPDTFELNIKLKSNKTIDNKIIPNIQQQEILDKIEEYYRNNRIGKIIWSCGLGKALLGILIVQKLKFSSVVIGVPGINLQKQMKNEIMKIFNDSKNILYINSDKDKTDNIISTTDENDIKKFLNTATKSCKFIITTYASCHLLVNYKFDFKIGDEAHHLVGSESEKTKNSFHNIEASKTLFMTATEKVIEYNKTNKVIYSMDDKDIFGECIDTKTICWAIENKKITDYNLIILKNTEDEINNIINSLNLGDVIDNKDLFLSAYMSLKSIEKYSDLTHILIYTNKTENSELVKKYIDIILNLDIININKDNYYNNALHSNNNINLKEEINEFENSSWGIISSVYIFGEGFDCPVLNGVVFGENMESDIRIVQSTLRPNRLNKNKPDKKAYVIIPYIDTEDFTTDNESFDKCRKIIAKIRSVDEKLEQKINVVSLSKSSNKKKNNENKNSNYNDIIENGDDLTKILLRLRYSKALGSRCSEEQDEFNYVRQLNKGLNIQDKEDYAKEETKEYHQKYIEYIKDPEEYFKAKCVWTNWYDFMGVDTNKFIQDKNNWIKFCKEKSVKSLEDYKELCKKNDNIPFNPVDFYIGCLDICIELEFYTKRRK